MNPSVVKRCLVGAVLAIAATLPGFQQLHTSVEGLKLIADYEGCRLQPYQCSAGVWTDGIGNTSGVIPGKTITERQAAEGLISNVLRVERALERCVKQQPPQKVYDAAVSFAFNVGTGNACSSTLVKLLNQRRWADACRQLPRWVYVKGVFNQGLDNRRARRWPGVYREQTEMKKKLISGLFLMLWMALLIAAMVYPQGIFPVLAASGVWVACLLTWAVIPVALAALIKNGPLWQELRASLLKTITRKENVFISWVMRLLIVVSLAWTEWAITTVFYLLTVIAFWITRNQMAQQVAA